jgi:hypothetical protein
MAKSNNTTSLELARQAIDLPYCDLEAMPFECWVALVEQFTRLADKEQKQRDAGKLGKDAGKLGGAPKGNQNARKQKP